MLTALRYVLLCDGPVVERERRAWALAVDDYMRSLFQILCSVIYYSNSGTSCSELPFYVYSIAE
jgi:hypothetical protein